MNDTVVTLEAGKAPLPARVLEWLEFACLVQEHVEGYTIPQYGDFPNDQVTAWSAQQCVDQVHKYCERFGRGRRGPEEELRDLLKMAHYACVAHAKLSERKGGSGR